MTNFDLSDRVAIVTGGSRGLGHSIVLGLAQAGADIVIASRKLDNCKAVAEEVETTTGRQALPVACHVGHWDQLPDLVDAAYDHFGKVDILVTEELYDKVFDVNLKGPFRLAVLVGTRMVEQGSGSIINVSSIGSLRPYGGIVPYAAAKAGVNTMTVGLADAFGPNVRVNCVIPGSFRTDVVQHWDDATMKGAAERPNLKRIGEPDEIVGAVLYFASDASSYTTGSLLRVDGGAVS